MSIKSKASPYRFDNKYVHLKLKQKVDFKTIDLYFLSINKT